MASAVTEVAARSPIIFLIMSLHVKVCKNSCMYISHWHFIKIYNQTYTLLKKYAHLKYILSSGIEYCSIKGPM